MALAASVVLAVATAVRGAGRRAAARAGCGSVLRCWHSRDVTVRYGDTAAVDDVSLDLASGQVLAVLGPSGCGKSTLLRAVAGLEPLASGSIAWDGADLAGTPTHKRGFALMFQDGQLFAHLTVARNVAYALRLRRTPSARVAARVRELLDARRAVGVRRPAARHAVRGRAAAGRPRPGAGRRAAADPARRAAVGARRVAARAAGRRPARRSCTRPGRRRCWSPTTTRRPSRSPTGWR